MAHLFPGHQCYLFGPRSCFKMIVNEQNFNVE